MSKTQKEKVRKIPVKEFNRVMKETYVPEETFVWNDIEVTIKKNISLKEMLGFVDAAVNSCFSEATNTYMPEVKDFAIRVNVLERYANFTMPSDVEAQYDLVYCTDIFERILEHINIAQFDDILTAIEKRTTHMAQANIEAINQQMNELYTSFDNIQTCLGGIFNNINEDDIRNISNALSNGTIDEEKLVNAYIKGTHSGKE